MTGRENFGIQRDIIQGGCEWGWPTIEELIHQERESEICLNLMPRNNRLSAWFYLSPLKINEIDRWRDRLRKYRETHKKMRKMGRERY